jgi:hypothetical protein
MAREKAKLFTGVKALPTATLAMVGVTPQVVSGSLCGRLFACLVPEAHNSHGSTTTPSLSWPVR